MKKKYLIIGNAENTHMLKWVRALAGYFDLYVLSSKNTHESIHELLPRDHIIDLDLDLSEEGGNYKLILEYFRIRRIIRDIQPAIVNPHYITSHGFLAALAKRFSRRRFLLVQSAWGTDILVTPFRNRVYHRITRFCLKTADLATSDSLHMTDVLTGIYPVSTLTFSFGLEEMPDFDLAEKDLHLYYSNRMLSPNYNVDEVLRFFREILDADPDARLIIAHDGAERRNLESRAGQLGLENRVSFKGFVGEKEQAANYRKAGFYFSIPTSDATSVSLLEAMAYGCIPIVSDIPANREWITEGLNGIYYRKGKTLATDLIKAAKKSREMAAKSREIIKERAIFPDAIRKYVDHLNTLTG